MAVVGEYFQLRSRIREYGDALTKIEANELSFVTRIWDYNAIRQLVAQREIARTRRGTAARVLRYRTRASNVKRHPPLL